MCHARPAFRVIQKIRSVTDVDRVACLVDVRINNRHCIGRLTLFLILDHRDRRIRPLVPPLVPFTINRRVFVSAIREVNPPKGSLVADVL